MNRIYVASSWRNLYQPGVVNLLREMGHDPYDFRNPKPYDDGMKTPHTEVAKGFSWDDIDPNWRDWTMEEYKAVLGSEAACRGYELNMLALKCCDTFLLVLPCGRSSHMEAGYAIPRINRDAGCWRVDHPQDVFWHRKQPYQTAVYIPEPIEPELMYKMFDHILLGHDELVEWATNLPKPVHCDWF